MLICLFDELYVDLVFGFDVHLDDDLDDDLDVDLYVVLDVVLYYSEDRFTTIWG